jgi:hypothetical protein
MALMFKASINALTTSCTMAPKFCNAIATNGNTRIALKTRLASRYEMAVLFTSVSPSNFNIQSNFNSTASASPQRRPMLSKHVICFFRRTRASKNEDSPLPALRRTRHS